MGAAESSSARLPERCSSATTSPETAGATSATSATIEAMRMTPRRLAIGMSLWVPNLFSGIRVRRFADDWTSATVELHVNMFTATT